jgi:hypothetical protein
MLQAQVTGCLIYLIHSSYTMGLGSTQPQREISTTNLPGDKGQPVHTANNFNAICDPTILKYGSLNVSQPYMTPQLSTGINVTFLALQNEEELDGVWISKGQPIYMS